MLVQTRVDDTLVISLQVFLDEACAALFLVLAMERAVVSVDREGSAGVGAISSHI